jgi:hypothetical protein
MQALGFQLMRGIALEKNGQSLDRMRLPADDQMDMIRHQGTSVNNAIGTLDISAKSARDRAGLQTGKDDRLVSQGSLGRQAFGTIVSDMRDGMFEIDLRSRAEFSKFIRSDEIRPRATGVVGEPEAIGAEDEVVSADANEHY